MANRILVGNRATGGYGLYVSQSGDDVLTTTEPLLFDSRAGNSWTVKKIQQGTIAANGAMHTINHALGYRPMVALRWSPSITSGYATEVYNPVWAEHWREDPVQGTDDLTEGYWRDGCRWYHHDDNNIKIVNMCNQAYYDNQGQYGTPSFLSNSAIYYAVILFNNKDPFLTSSSDAGGTSI